MKLKFINFVVFVICIFSFVNVNASSIDYNVRIDKDLHFYETINYSIDKKDVKNDGNYNFLTSIVNDPVYFDLKEDNVYKKSKTNTTNGYLVTLKYDYSHLFLTKSRILNECFVDKDFDSNAKYISFSASDFYCSHRADSIKVSITTDLDVSSSNASSSEGNVYTWDNVSKDFNMSFRAKVPSIETEPMDDIQTENQQSNSSDNQNNVNTNKEKKHINKNVVFAIIGVLIITSFGVIIILKSKNNNLNKI